MPRVPFSRGRQWRGPVTGDWCLDMRSRNEVPPRDGREGNAHVEKQQEPSAQRPKRKAGLAPGGFQYAENSSKQFSTANLTLRHRANLAFPSLAPRPRPTEASILNREDLLSRKLRPGLQGLYPGHARMAPGNERSAESTMN